MASGHNQGPGKRDPMNSNEGRQHEKMEIDSPTGSDEEDITEARGAGQLQLNNTTPNKKPLIHKAKLNYPGSHAAGLGSPTASSGFGTGSPGFGTGSPGFGKASPGFGTASPGFGTGSPVSPAASLGFPTASPGFSTASSGFGTTSSGSHTASSAFGTTSSVSSAESSGGDAWYPEMVSSEAKFLAGNYTHETPTPQVDEIVSTFPVKAWSCFKIVVTKTIGKEEDIKRRESAIDPVKMQFLAYKMHEDLMSVLQPEGTIQLEEEILSVRYHHSKDLKAVIDLMESKLKEVVKGVEKVFVPVSKGTIQKVMFSEDEQKEFMAMNIVIVFDRKTYEIIACGKGKDISRAKDLLKRYEEQENRDCIKIEGITPFRIELFLRFEKPRIFSKYPKFVIHVLEDQNRVQIDGPQNDLSEYKKYFREFEHHHYSSVVDTGKAYLLLREAVQEHVNKLLLESKVDAVWKVEDLNLDIYASSESEAKEGFQLVESSISCFPIDEKTAVSNLFRVFCDQNKSMIYLCNVEGRHTLYTLNGVYMDFLDQWSKSVSKEMETNEQLHLAMSVQMSQPTKVMRKNLDNEECCILHHFSFPHFLKKRTHSNVTCTMSLENCEVEIKGNQEHLDQCLKLMEEFKKQIHQERLEMTPGQMILLRKKQCYDYVQEVIGCSLKTLYYVYLYVKGDKAEVHIYSRNKQELGMVRDLIKKCIHVQEMAVTEDEKTMFKSDEWKHFAAKCNDKMIVNGNYDIETEIEIVITSDLVKDLDEILQHCHDVLRPRQMVLEVSRHEFASASPVISKMKEQFNLKLELQDYWTSEKYLVHGEPKKCQEMLKKFWETFSRNTIDLSHCVEVDFIHSVEGQKYIKDLQKKISCAVSVNSDGWLEEPFHVYNVLNKEKAVYVSLMKGSTENMKADVIIFPVNTSGYPVCDREILLKKDRKRVTLCLTKEFQLKKFEIGDFYVISNTKNLPCEAMYCLVVESTRKENKNSLHSIKGAFSRILSDASKSGWKSIALPLYSYSASDSTGFVKEIADLLDDFLNFSIVQFAQSAIRLNIKSDGVSEIYVCSEDIRSLDTLKAIMWKKHVQSSSLQMYDFKSLLPRGKWTRLPNREKKTDIKVIFKEGSLADEKVDLLVNTVNTDLELGRGGISKILLKRGGQTIQDECNKHKKENNFRFGDVIFTSGGNGKLKCSAIAHGALPGWIPTTGLSLRVIKKIMWRCLKYADEFAFGSLAFPPFGTGNLEYPRTGVAKAMMECVKNYQEEHPETSVSEVRVCLYSGDPETLKSFKNVYETSLVEKVSPEFLPKMVPQSRIGTSTRTIQVQVIPADVVLITECEAVFSLSVKHYPLTATEQAKIMTVYDTQARCLKGSVNVGSRDWEFKRAIDKCLNFVNKERLTSVAFSVNSDLQMTDQLSWMREAISNYGSLNYLQTVYVLYERKNPHEWIKGLSSKEEKTGLFGMSKVPKWKEVKFHHVGEEQSKVEVSIFGEKEKVAEAQATLQLELDQLFYHGQSQSTEDTTASSSRNERVSEIFSCVRGIIDENVLDQWRDFAMAKKDIEGRKSVTISFNTEKHQAEMSSSSFLEFQAASEYMRTSGSSKFQKQTEESAFRKDQVAVFENIKVEKIQASECEFKALQFFFKDECWMNNFQLDWKENNLLFTTEGEIEEVKIMLETKLVYIRQMNKLDSALTVPSHMTNENSKAEIGRIIEQENKSNSNTEPKIFSYISENGKCLHLYGATYEKLLKVKHKVELALGMQTKGDGRRHQRFVAGTPENEVTVPKNENEEYRQTSQSQKRAVPKLNLSQPFSGPIQSEFTTTEGLKIKIYSASILKVKVECIVNAANNTLMHGGGVAYAISRAAGYDFDRECRDYISTHGSIKDGECCITSAGDLSYKNVIHTVGPRWSSYSKDQCLSLLRKSVAACFFMADNHSIQTIALPAISSGIFGVPKEYCVEEYYNAVIQYSQTRGNTSTLQEIHFVDQAQDMVSIIQKGFTMLFHSKVIPSANSPSIQQPLSPTGKSNLSRSNRFSKNPNVMDQQQSEVDAKNEKPLEPAAKKYKFWVKDKKDNVIILVYKGDLLAVKTDAIVCPQDKNCSNQTQIAKELLKKGNTTYKSAVQDWKLAEKPNVYTVTECSTYNSFPFKYVLHAVAPRYGEGGKMVFDNGMRSTMLYIFMKVREKNFQTIGLPLIGIGRRGFQESATKFSEELSREVRSLAWSTYPYPLKEVHVLCVDEQGVTVIKDALSHDSYLEWEVELEPVQKSSSTSQSVSMETDQNPASTPAEDIDCCICMDVCTDPKRLNCGHVFCTGCIAEQFKYKPSCPQCGAMYGKMTGNQPPGRVCINISSRDLQGYPGVGSIEINYDIPAGYQREGHPNPGTMYERINRSGHLPNTSKGRLVCKLLNVAFTRKLIFTIGHSRTTGKDGVVTWNDIHHKTRREGGPQRFGYPDDTYLDRVMEELAVKGVTEDSVDQDEHKEYTKEFGEHW